MDSKSKIIKLVISVLIVLQVLSLVMLYFLGTELKSLKNEFNTVYNNISRIKSDINNNIFSIKEDLKENSSLLEEIDIESGDLNKIDFTYPLEISLIPKESNQYTKIYFKFKNEKILLKNLDGTFKGEIKSKLYFDDFQNEDEDALIIIENNGTFKQEKIDSYAYELNKSIIDVFPYIIPRIYTSISNSDNKYSFDFDIMLDIINAGNHKFRNIDFIIEKNGKEITRLKDLQNFNRNDKEENSSATEKVNDDSQDLIWESQKFDFELDKNDEINWKIICSTNKKYTYEVNFSDKFIPKGIEEGSEDFSNFSREIEMGDCDISIKDKNGKIIYRYTISNND